MTDKVQKIRKEVEKLHGNPYYMMAVKDVLEILDMQEEPVSKELKVELEKYIKDHFTIDTEQLDRFGIEEKDYMYSMDKNDMLALVEHFINWHKTKEEPVTEDLEEAVNAYISNENNYHHSRTDTFKAGAEWQKEQFEKNRLAACDRQTEKEADIECDFVVSIIEKEHRLPTFDDAIKYGMTLQKKQMKEALRIEYEKGRHDALEEMKKSKQC